MPNNSYRSEKKERTRVSGIAAIKRQIFADFFDANTNKSGKNASSDTFDTYVFSTLHP